LKGKTNRMSIRRQPKKFGYLKHVLPLKDFRPSNLNKKKHFCSLRRASGLDIYGVVTASAPKGRCRDGPGQAKSDFDPWRRPVRTQRERQR
jgi:hypothetical protein